MGCRFDEFARLCPESLRQASHDVPSQPERRSHSRRHHSRRALSARPPRATLLSVPQPDPAPKTLDDLMARAEHYANYCMRGTGHVTPAVFILGPDGLLMFAPESLADERAKDNFADQARLMCLAHAATACVMVLEAWAKFAKPDEKFDMTEAPSEAIDRREVVMLMGESHEGQKQKLLPIIRSGNGKFFGFGESEGPKWDSIKGRFAQILPSKFPDAALRELAKVMLEIKGVGRAASGNAPRLPRSRR